MIRAIAFNDRFLQGVNVLIVKNNAQYPFGAYYIDDFLNHTLKFERAVLEFYKTLRDVVGEDCEPLNAIIDVEKDHVLKVMQLIFTGEKYRGRDDKFPNTDSTSV